MTEYDTGAYGIFNTVNGKVYVGSVVTSFQRRKRQHFWHLKKGTHHSKHLQRAYDKYGADCFDFRVLERCPPEEALVVEQRWIDSLDSANMRKGYNISPTAGNTAGRKHSEETRAKIKARLGTEETKAKMSASQKAVWDATYEARAARMSAVHKGKKVSPETRAEALCGDEGEDGRCQGSLFAGTRCHPHR